MNRRVHCWRERERERELGRVGTIPLHDWQAWLMALLIGRGVQDQFPAPTRIPRADMLVHDWPHLLTTSPLFLWSTTIVLTSLLLFLIDFVQTSCNILARDPRPSLRFSSHFFLSICQGSKCYITHANRTARQTLFSCLQPSPMMIFALLVILSSVATLADSACPTGSK